MLKLARAILPARARRRLLRNFLHERKEFLSQQTKALPSVKLEERHIANLKMLVNRKALLRLLPQNGVGCELGVNTGEFSRQILRLANPAKLTLVDPWDTERYGEKKFQAVSKRFADDIAAGRVELIRGYSTEAGKGFADGTFDWVYIDTTHAYELTRDELRLYAHKVKPGGILAGHDYSKGNVVSGVVYGVIDAVQEFCVENDWEFIHLTMEPQTPSFAIRKIGAAA
ncbi:MAG: class I SAM-dependent methyltransferase [Maritimibacter sp.]|nr:class I SAM-dependent methyltransferase [Maritimibacter sp.]